MTIINTITTGARKLRDYSDRRRREVAENEAQIQADRAMAFRARKFKPAGRDMYTHPKTGKQVTAAEMAADAVRTREYVRKKVLEEKLGPSIERSIERTIRKGERSI